MGGQMGNVPFLHSVSFNTSCGDLRLKLMAPCQSGVSKIRRLNADLGGTRRIPRRGTVGNFDNFNNFTFCRRYGARNGGSLSSTINLILRLCLYYFLHINPQQHKQPSNTTTMVVELLAPPAAWIQ
jgi:hypothetical protein